VYDSFLCLQPTSHVQHLVPPSLMPPRVVDPATIRGWAEPFVSRLSRPVDVSGISWQPYPAAWYAPNNNGFSVVRTFPEIERVAEGNPPENVTKGVLARSEDPQVDGKYGPARKDSSSAENLGDSTDGDQQAAESSLGGYPRETVGVPDPGQGNDWHKK
jgi:hypothetical protein